MRGIEHGLLRAQFTIAVDDLGQRIGVEQGTALRIEDGAGRETKAGDSLATPWAFQTFITLTSTGPLAFPDINGQFAAARSRLPAIPILPAPSRSPF
ncbi:MAG: hypothetical protein Q8M37_09970 [Nevskia sp.]|nr:hypothetical protein [Nevskia sp.]